VVEIENLTKRFGELTVLDGVDLSVRSHRSVALIGPSGSGKSTLLRCVGGLEVPTSGRISLSGKVVDASMGGGELRRSVASLRGRAPLVFQSFNLFPHRTAVENVIEGPLIVKRMHREEAVALGEQLLDRVGMLDKRDEHPSRLSGGQQQRVAIARALAMSPQVMLFDEPTSALDPELVGEVQKVIRELVLDGMTAIIVTHAMDFAADLVDEIVFLDKGRIVERGQPKEFLSAPKTERARRFLGKG
jgi:ABC-type polar amino acid transport system ATPase subunit